MKRGWCPVCRYSWRVNKDSNMGAHNWGWNPRRPCPGSGEQPVHMPKVKTPA